MGISICITKKLILPHLNFVNLSEYFISTFQIKLHVANLIALKQIHNINNILLE